MAIKIDLKAAREEKGLSQKDVAREVGMTPLAYANIENNKTRSIDLDKLDKICKTVGVKPSDAIKSD
jgi:putative transcriptional regulator